MSEFYAPEKNTRYLPTEVPNPVTSALRRRKPAIIPPFSFVGELEAGGSGWWYPTSTTILQSMSAASSGTGNGAALIQLYKKEPSLFPDLTPPTYIGGVTLGADGKKVIGSLNEVVVTPHDKVFAVCWNGTGHPNVVVQAVGVIMT